MIRAGWVRVSTLVIVVAFIAFSAGAGIAIRWQKDEVIAVVLVRRGFGGFVPSDGSSIGNVWNKSEVKPVLLLKPGIGGFESHEGFSIGNTWQKGDVLLVMLVEVGSEGFVPLRPLDSKPMTQPSMEARKAGGHSQPNVMKGTAADKFDIGKS